MSDSGGAGALRAATVARAHARKRVDLVRTALRRREIDVEAVREELDDWIALFRRDHQAPLRVLLLELLNQVEDPRVLALAEHAREDRWDSVRFEAVHLLMSRVPERASELAEAHLEDPGVELRLLAAERIHARDPARARNALLQLAQEEAQGRRETHVLDRVTEFLVETARDRSVVPQLRSLQDHCEDPEGFLAWAIDRLEGGRG